MEDYECNKKNIKTEVEDVEENSDHDEDIVSEATESGMGETNLADQFEPGIKQENQNEELEFAIKCKNEMKEEPLDEIEYNLIDIKVEPEPGYSMQDADHQIEELLCSNKCKLQMEEEINYELCNTDAKSIHIEEVITNTIDDVKISNVMSKCQRSAEKVEKVEKTQNLTFECDKCDFKTSVKKNLKQHKLNKHSNLKPFKCDKCSFKTKLKSTLQKHAYVHTQERPFKCDKCDYSGKFKAVLRRHQLTHTKFRPFKCAKCSYRTNRKFDLKVHQFKSHQLVHENM